MRLSWQMALSLAIFLARAGAIIAGPPLVTDDPQTPGKRSWEVNLSHNIEKMRDEFFMESPLIDINYGIRDNDQFKVEFAVVSADPTDDQNHWGMNDLLIGYKYRFVDEEQAGWMVSFYPQVTVPTGNSRLGFGSGSAQLLAPFQMGKHLFDERRFVYGEVGYDVVFGNPEANSWMFGAAAEWKTSEQMELLGEVVAFTFPHDAEPDDVFFNLGLKYELHKHAAFIGSAGRSFLDRGHGTPEFMSFIGLQLTWGGDPQKSQSTAKCP